MAQSAHLGRPTCETVAERSATLLGTTLRLRIAELRERRGLTIDELAKRAGVGRSTVIRLEQARTTRVDLAVLEKLSRALGVSVGRLFVNAETGDP
jgi:transcriptional regulator with XRE-family HTH domain